METTSIVQETEIPRIPIVEILKDDEFNCRGVIPPADVFELATDISKNGLSQPVMVRYLTPDEMIKHPGKKYGLVMGFRRTSAAISLHWQDIPCIVRDVTLEQAKILNLTENLHRKDLTLWQECQTIRELHDRGMTRQAISDAINKPMGWVQRRQNVLKMPKEIQDMVEANILGSTHVQALFSYEVEDEMLEVARDIRRRFQNHGGDTEFQIRIPKPTKTKRNAGIVKKQRKPDEILNLQRYLRSIGLPQGLEYRLLAWCAGEISDLELQASIKDEMFEMYETKVEIHPNGIPAMTT